MNQLPDLRIKSDRIRPLSMYDLRRFLYARPFCKNGKALDSRWFFKRINAGQVGSARTERLDLIIAIKEEFETKLEIGGAISTLDHYIAAMQLFFDFCDAEGVPATLDNLENAYLQYCEYLFQKSQKRKAEIKILTAYGYASVLSHLFGNILEIPVAVELINRTRLPYPKTTKKAVGRQADKQSLESTFKMGSFLVDLMTGITIDKIHGELPFEIPVRNGLVKNNLLVLTVNNLRTKYEHLLSAPSETLTARERKILHTLRKTRGPVTTIKGTKRHYFVSLRVTAELLVFIAQTGMNLGQARKIPRSQFRYKPAGDSWEIRCYKHRRGGEISFKIYKSYKPFLEEYIAFIDIFFPESDLLFPWFDKNGEVSKSRGLTFHSLYKLLKEHEIPWFSPMKLRKTRINWCLRRSGDNAELTSEMHQHLKETLRGSYELPSQQRSMVELTRFWNENDPIRQGELKISLISSQCSGVPVPTNDKPSAVVSPNCVNQSGCLWCKNLRDLDSFDYIWSLASFRHLKSIEAAGVIRKDVIPADLVVDRITEKIEWYRKSSQKRVTWVDEAETRILEGHYHPTWSNILEFLE